MNRQLKLFPNQTVLQKLFRQKFLSSDFSASHVCVCFASQKNSQDPISYRRLCMSAKLESQFRAIALKFLDTCADDLEDDRLDIRDYQAGIKLADHEVEHIRISSEGRVQAQNDPLHEPLEFDDFVEEKSFAKHLRYYVIIVESPDGNPSNSLRFYRRFTEAGTLEHKGFAIFKGFQQNVYDSMIEEAFLIDHDIDCLSRGDDMFIFEKNRFQRIFQFYESIKQDAKSVISRIHTQLPILNLDDFIAACERDERMASKIADLENQPHLKHLSIPCAQRAINKYHLHVKIEAHEGKQKLRYSSSYKWEFVRLISDEYLSSEATNIDYEVSVKRPLKLDSITSDGDPDAIIEVPASMRTRKPRPSAYTDAR